MHARSHDDKVLFTINKVTAPEFRDRIKKIILMTKDGLLAGVFAFRKESIIAPRLNYTVPSIWDNEDRSNVGWFALNNLKRTEIKKKVITPLPITPTLLKVWAEMLAFSISSY